MPATPLVLVPGLLCTAALYLPQIEVLGARRTVMVADHTGADDIARIAAAILAVAPPRFALAGLSMGGYVAMEMIRRAPDRVERLALLDTQAGADTDAARDARLQQIDIVRRGGFGRIADMLMPRLLAPDHAADPRLPAVVRAMANATGPEAFVLQQTAIMERIDSRPRLGAIACPTLVLVGEKDILTPPEKAEEMASAIPGSRLVVVPGAGHLSTLEAPEAVTAALADWLVA